MVVTDVITPHLASSAREARHRLMRALLEGRPQNVVNRKYLGN
jgi:phosphoglycerate dehydrogenase-like enzyme